VLSAIEAISASLALYVSSSQRLGRPTQQFRWSCNNQKVRHRRNHNILDNLKEKLQNRCLTVWIQKKFALNSSSVMSSHPFDHYLRLIGNPALAFGNELDPWSPPKPKLEHWEEIDFVLPHHAKYIFILAVRIRDLPHCLQIIQAGTFLVFRQSRCAIIGWCGGWGWSSFCGLTLTPTTRDSLFRQGRNSATPTMQLCCRSFVCDNTRWIMHFLSREDLSVVSIAPKSIWNTQP